jgi:hypothetical protein
VNRNRYRMELPLSIKDEELVNKETWSGRASLGDR